VSGFVTIGPMRPGLAKELSVALLTASIDPARQTATAHFFCALDAQPGGARKLDESEDIDTVLMARDELLGAIETGRLVHGIHMAAILMAERRGLL